MTLPLSYASALMTIQDATDSLVSSQLVETPLTIEDDTVLVGSDSPLDSIAFITLIMEIEQRLRAMYPKRVPPFVISAADLFGQGEKQQLTVARLAMHLVVACPSD